MTGVPPIETLTVAASQIAAGSAQPAPAPSPPPQTSFADMLSRAGNALEARLDHADELTHRFVVGEDVPAHEVVIALEQARLAVELAVEVRTRTIEAYREIMNMQL